MAANLLPAGSLVRKALGVGCINTDRSDLRIQVARMRAALHEFVIAENELQAADAVNWLYYTYFVFFSRWQMLDRWVGLV